MKKYIIIYIFIYDCIEYLKNVWLYLKIFIRHIAKCTITKCTITNDNNNITQNKLLKTNKKKNFFQI